VGQILPQRLWEAILQEVDETDRFFTTSSDQYIWVTLSEFVETFHLKRIQSMVLNNIG
jgi:hypothetical protein